MEVKPVDCIDTKHLLVEAAEGVLAEAERPPLDEHLRGCADCRAELDAMRHASRVLSLAADELAPQRAYLTEERRERLVVAYRRRTRIFRLATYRQFVAAAAAVAIIVSTAFMGWQLGHMSAPLPPDEPTVVTMPAPSPYVPVVLAAMEQGGPGAAMRSMPVSTGPALWTGPSGRGITPVMTDSAGVAVPVDHVLYDPDESSRWW